MNRIYTFLGAEATLADILFAAMVIALTFLV